MKPLVMNYNSKLINEKSRCNFTKSTIKIEAFLRIRPHNEFNLASEASSSDN